MDTETGRIRELGPDEDPRENEILIRERLAQILLQYEEKERLDIVRGLQSPNRSARRKANKKIAKRARRNEGRVS